MRQLSIVNLCWFSKYTTTDTEDDECMSNILPELITMMKMIICIMKLLRLLMVVLVKVNFRVVIVLQYQ